MADYWLSFRITDDFNYNKRYTDLTKAIAECATGGQWTADTSFVCIRSKHTIDECGQHLKKALNGTTDHLAMREIGKDDTRYINSPGPNFTAFFPTAKKL